MTDPTAAQAFTTDFPSSARGYGWMLGGKDNYRVDREMVLEILRRFPANLDSARANRRFLGRAVRHLAAECGVRQFIDLGCGLPTDNNVHQVAQNIDPKARVVYVDTDPLVLAHGRALLADDATTTAIITADIRDPNAVLDAPETQRLIDFNEPYAVLMFSVGHHLRDQDIHPRLIIDALLMAGPRINYLAFSQAVDENAERGRQMADTFNAVGIPWQNRTPEQVDAMLDGLETVEPGLVNVDEWRPEPFEPKLPPVPAALEEWEGASKHTPEAYEYGGVLFLP
ncbi:SAM-dependent methyltransferase [Actinomadura nitritigenes]|uniref:SAM-dependent methyltransferase n=1 Tax=Actinomadura nitritigenes TaxID=134602 RepID=UPI003D9005D3